MSVLFILNCNWLSCNQSLLPIAVDINIIWCLWESIYYNNYVRLHMIMKLLWLWCRFSLTLITILKSSLFGVGFRVTTGDVKLICESFSVYQWLQTILTKFKPLKPWLIRRHSSLFHTKNRNCTPRRSFFYTGTIIILNNYLSKDFVFTE